MALTDKVECPKCRGSGCGHCEHGVVEVELDAGPEIQERLDENRKAPEPLPLGRRLKRQTRRSLSVKGITYQRLKDYCDSIGKSVSGYIEELVDEDLTSKGVDLVAVVRPKPPSKKRKSNLVRPPSQRVTF